MPWAVIRAKEAANFARQRDVPEDIRLHDGTLHFATLMDAYCSSFLCLAASGFDSYTAEYFVLPSGKVQRSLIVKLILETTGDREIRILLGDVESVPDNAILARRLGLDEQVDCVYDAACGSMGRTTTWRIPFSKVGTPSCGLHEGNPRPKQAAGANCRLRGCQQLELVPACQAVCHESFAARLSLANKAEL